MFCRGQALDVKIQYAGNAIWSFPAYQNWIWLSQSVWNIVWNFLETNSYILRTQADRQSPFDRGVRSKTCVNALSGLYLISTVPLQKPRFYAVSRACFCRYLSEYSDSSCFSCMLTFWTYLMRCTYPWHWIKYSTNYNRCHPIFFTLLISWAEQ